MKRKKINYTKSNCYLLVEFLDALTKYNKETIYNICDGLGMTDPQSKMHALGLLEVLASDIDRIITIDKKSVPDNYSWATIMNLAHIPDNKQDR